MPVHDDEVLYRRVLDNGQHVIVDGATVRVSSQAFTDSNQKPSVDLSSLCATCGGATWTQNGDENGVLTLITRKVREITVRGKKPAAPDAPSNTPATDVEHAVDVYPDPRPATETERENHAHAEIRPTPEWCNANVFRKLREGLARIAAVKIHPKGLRR